MYTAATGEYSGKRDFSKSIMKEKMTGEQEDIYKYEYNPFFDIKEKRETGRTQQQDIIYYYPTEIPIPEKSRPISLIRPEMDQSCQAYLTPDIKDIINKLTAITLTKAHNSSIEIESILLTVFHDPEENWTELVFNINVRALSNQALAFWDCLGKAIDQWKIRLSDWYANLLNERISIDVFWV